MQQGVAQREAGVDGVTRRASIAPGELQGRGHDASQATKVGAGGGTFAATQVGQVGQGFKGCRRGGQITQSRVNSLERVKKGFSGIRSLCLQGAQRAVLAAQLGAHHAQCPLATPGVVHHTGGLGQAHGGVVVLWAKDDGNATGLARTHEHGGGTCLGQFHEHASVKPGLCAMDDATVNQLDGYGAPALACFVQG